MLYSIWFFSFWIWLDLSRAKCKALGKRVLHTDHDSTSLYKQKYCIQDFFFPSEKRIWNFFYFSVNTYANSVFLNLNYVGGFFLAAISEVSMGYNQMTSHGCKNIRGTSFPQRIDAWLLNLNFFFLKISCLGNPGLKLKIGLGSKAQSFF